MKPIRCMHGEIKPDAPEDVKAQYYWTDEVKHKAGGQNSKSKQCGSDKVSFGQPGKQKQQKIEHESRQDKQ